MAQNVVESIFNSKKNLSDFYPQFPNLRAFDLEKKHLLYGRIDRQGDAVYLDDANLAQIVGAQGSSHLIANFVEKAFSDLRTSTKLAAGRGIISGNSVYPADLKAHKSWRTGDLEHSYATYLNKIYETFVDSYLSIDRRDSKVIDFKSFIKEFLRFSLRTARYFPVTKTGYILSIHCSPFVSGLAVEIAAERHGIHNNANVFRYIKDDNFVFFVNQVKKFGFMVDKNAPWRIVFNLASGWDDYKKDGSLTGAQKYMNNYAVNFDNVFDVFYRKSHFDDLQALKSKLYTLYNAYYLQNSTYEKLDYHTVCSKSLGQHQLNYKSNRHDRQPPPPLDSPLMNDEEYWIKLLLKLRMAESGRVHDAHDFGSFSKRAIEHARLFSLNAALDYINELTKGLHVTKFLNKGSYWYGMTDQEYQQRKIKALREASNPSMADYELTSTKNFK